MATASPVVWSMVVPDNVQVVAGVVTWVCCSVGMVVFNKLAVSAFNLSCVLVAVQMLFTSVAIGTLGARTLHFGSLRDVCRWSTVVPFYAGMLLTSLLALKHSSMTLVVTFRAISPILGLIVERFYPMPPRVTPWIVASLMLLVIGAGVFTVGMDRSQVRGLAWVIVNNVFAVGDRLLQRLMLSREQCPVDISKSGCALLNNALGLIPILVVVAITREYEAVPGQLATLDSRGIAYIVVSCFVGMGISYTGIWAQSMITATSFLVLVNANKFSIIILEACFLRSDPLGPVQIAAAIVTIVASLLYGKAQRMATLSRPVDSEKVPILKKV